MDEVLNFRSASEFREWLAKNHLQPDRIRLQIAKKGAEQASITYAEALDEALCFGWIDGQKEPLDESAWLQRFSPRRARSGWSRINTEHAERLIAAGRMEAAGQAEIDAAKRDGRWVAAYDSPSKATFPEEFLAALRKDERANAFFASLNKANRYAIAYRLQTAKKVETKQKRMETILAMLAKGEVFHPYLLALGSRPVALCFVLFSDRSTEQRLPVPMIQDRLRRVRGVHWPFLAS